MSILIVVVLAPILLTAIGAAVITLTIYIERKLNGYEKD